MTVGDLSGHVASVITNRLKDLQTPNYKYVVQVVIGEQRGQGLRMHSACCWDVDTDAQATYLYRNDYLFCQVLVFAVFHY
ncbi:tctex1 domain-containing protein 2 [Aphelenchoides avenae]|nr:tctex1 domain-containing protein 2 [Aphelenchus avenae]